MKALRIFWLVAAMMVAAGMALQAQQFTVALKNGEKFTYNNADVDSVYFHETISDPEPVYVAPKIGDYYYSDGSWSTNLDASKTPIGLVFCVGIADGYKDREAYYTIKDGSTPFDQFHGYVVALRDATSCEGAPDDNVWWSPFNNDHGGGCSTDITDFLGYTNTRSIMATAGTLTAENYPAAYMATTFYESVCPAPEQSSGWFLPSAAQWKYIYDRVYFDEDQSGRSCLLNSMLALDEADYELLYRNDAEYWSSTEKIDSYAISNFAYYFCFDESIFKPGFIADYRKNTGFKVRSILAF